MSLASSSSNNRAKRGGAASTQNNACIVPDLLKDDAQPLEAFKELNESLFGQHIIRESTLASFQATNCFATIPNAEETADIRRAISSASLMRQELGDVIAALGYLQKSLGIFSDTYKRSISAVGRLPAEILTDIFLLSRTQYLGIEHSAHKTARNIVHASFNVAQICKHWRNIALNTPRLWNTIHLIGAKDIATERLYAQLEILSRTASVSPYLVIGLPAAHVRFLQRCDNKELLRTFQKKCKGLDVYTVQENKNHPNHIADYASIWPVLIGFKQLEKLTLSDVLLSEPAIEHTTWVNLTHLHLQTKGGPITSAFFGMSPMPDLRVLILHLVGEIRLDLDFYPNLTDLYFSGSIKADPFYHEKLERLLISDDKALGSFLEAATLPSLKELGTYINDITEAPLTEFLLRSTVPLRRLTCINILFRFPKLVTHQAEPMALGNQIGKTFSVPLVEYYGSWLNTQMMLDLKTRWYAQS
ncbi:hypothetical protein CONPUDRAFT_149684 [Coniophora puteana RWD-64-598 SS2]|uniref:F-box domain-containing protein n=1 Tax=Coniophora puteana (strain RWD-64-598) TaxID=741705 RepID=A0A5M3N0L5_CONPW|nr:uncharacterized protein CONPUDRAFT_149684 [Coniophora puteana RWD-64-598 SS2]EIW84816.1 hypothetical protein CONPUDRAFT_149684 [Coniophora puteana RWD-64-598 SS2]